MFKRPSMRRVVHGLLGIALVGVGCMGLWTSYASPDLVQSSSQPREGRKEELAEILLFLQRAGPGKRLVGYMALQRLATFDSENFDEPLDALADEVSKGLSAPGADERMYALSCLGLIDPRRLTKNECEILLKGLRDSSPVVRQEALSWAYLARGRNKDVNDLVVALAFGGDKDARARFASAVPLTEELSQSLRERVGIVDEGMWVLEALAEYRVSDPKTCEALYRLVDGSLPKTPLPIAVKAMRALEASHCKGDFERLIEVARKHPREEISGWALRLASVQMPQSIEVVAEAQTCIEERRAVADAIEALGNLKGLERLTVPLYLETADRYPRLVPQVIRSWSQQEPASKVYLQFIVKSLQSLDPDVKEQASLAACSNGIEDAAAKEVVKAVIADKNNRLLQPYLKGAFIVSEIRTLVRSEDESEVMRGLDTVGRMELPLPLELQKDVASLLKSPSARIRAAAVLNKPDISVDELGVALEDLHAGVRGRAINVAGRRVLDDRAFEKLLQKAMGDANPWVYRAAIQAVQARERTRATHVNRV